MHGQTERHRETPKQWVTLHEWINYKAALQIQFLALEKKTRSIDYVLGPLRSYKNDDLTVLSVMDCPPPAKLIKFSF